MDHLTGVWLLLLLAFVSGLLWGIGLAAL